MVMKSKAMRTLISVVQAIFFSIALLTAFLIGAVLYLLLSPMILPSSPASPLLSAGKALYRWIGIASLGLAPLGIYLLFVASRMVLQGLRKGQRVHPPREALELIVSASPALGVLGTILSLLGAIGSVDVAHQMSQAFNSLILGIFLALLAFVLKYVEELLPASPGGAQGPSPARRDPARDGDKGAKRVPEKRLTLPNRLTPNPSLVSPAKPRPEVWQKTGIPQALPKAKDPRGAKAPGKSSTESCWSRRSSGRALAPPPFLPSPGNRPTPPLSFSQEETRAAPVSRKRGERGAPWGRDIRGPLQGPRHPGGGSR